MTSKQLIQAIEDKSGTEVARWIHPDLSERHDSGVPGLDSLAKYVRDLKRGEAGWWMGEGPVRVSARRLLAKYTGIPLELLGLVQAASGELDYVGFREVGPLEARHAPPPDLGSPSLFDLQFDHDCLWIVVPPGFGKTFAVGWARLQGLRTLEAADVGQLVERLPSSGPAVADLSTDTELADEPSLLTRLARRAAALGGLVVLASRPPRLEELLERGGRSSQMPRKKRSRTAVPRGWRVERFVPAEDWRERLFEWLVGRLSTGSRVDADTAGRALASLVQAGQVETPGELVPLAALLHELGVPGLSLSPTELARHYVRERLEGLAEVSNDHGWFISEAPQLLSKIYGLRTSELRDGLEAGMPRSRWLDLAAQAQPRTPPTELVDLVIDGVAGKRGRELEKEARRLKRELPERAPASLIATLESIGLLRERKGLLQLEPGWLHGRLLREALRERWASCPVQDWGRDLLVRPRAMVVDRELRVLSLEPEPWKRLSQRVGDEDDRKTASWVAALEAVVAATGTSLAENPEMTLVAPFAQLLDLQIELLRADGKLSARLPAMRTLFGHARACLEWLTTSNAAAERLPRGSWHHDGLNPWLVLAYQEKVDTSHRPRVLQSAPLSSRVGPHDQGDPLHDERERLLRFLRRNVDKLVLHEGCVSGTGWESLSGAVQALIFDRLLLEAHPDAPAALRGLYDHWNQQELERHLDTLPRSRKRLVADAIVSQSPKREEGFLPVLTNLRGESITDFVAEHASDGVLDDLLAESGLGWKKFSSDLDTLNDRILRRVIHGLLASDAETDLGDVLRNRDLAIRLCVDEMADLRQALLRSPAITRDFGDVLWDQKPREVLAAMTDALATGDSEHVERLIYRAPYWAAYEVEHWLREHPGFESPAPSWWALRLLKEASLSSVEEVEALHRVARR